jgi:hypothetical protein
VPGALDTPAVVTNLEIRPMTFVIRMSRNAEGTLRGVVERVSTGAKEAFSDVHEIGSILERLAGRERED